MKRPNLSGKRFGKLVAINFQHGRGGWLCQCDCGKQRWFDTHSLTDGNNSSCGCLSNQSNRPRERHGMWKSQEYKVWIALKKRCHNPANLDYKYYGGRGIKVCEKWDNSFVAYFKDTGRRPKGFWLDRLNNSKGYEPGNVAWRTPTQQQRNRRNNRLWLIDGKKMTLGEAVEKFGVAGLTLKTARQRICYGWNIKTALAKPQRPHRPCQK